MTSQGGAPGAAPGNASRRDVGGPRRVGLLIGLVVVALCPALYLVLGAILVRCGLQPCEDGWRSTPGPYLGLIAGGLSAACVAAPFALVPWAVRHVRRSTAAGVLSVWFLLVALIVFFPI